MVQEVVIQRRSDSDAAAGAAVISTAITEVAGVIKELEKVAISSPIVSIAVAIITADILHNSKLISDGAYLSIMALTISAGGISLAADVSQLLQSIDPVTGLFKSSTQPAGLLTNSVSTLVTVQGEQNAQLNALLAKK